ncbi:hypothetical protein V8F06_014631 [Rhypophila decipiens]
MGFTRGLFWTPKYKQDTRRRISISRRLGFPSWSWVGWRGSVDYCSEYGPDMANDGTFMSPDMDRFDTSFWVEDSGGLLLDFQKLASTTSQTTMMIPELSPHLIVEARIFRFRFQPDDLGNLAVSHGGIVYNNSRWEAVIFCNQPSWVQPQDSNDMYRRKTSETWDCVLLFQSTKGRQNLLIVEWVKNVAYRVGVLSLRDEENVLGSIPSSRRRIRLG